LAGFLGVPADPDQIHHDREGAMSPTHLMISCAIAKKLA
jgi:hypothetical protein